MVIGQLALCLRLGKGSSVGLQALVAFLLIPI